MTEKNNRERKRMEENKGAYKSGAMLNNGLTY